MAKFNRGDKVVLYKVEEESSRYKKYLGHIGVVMSDGSIAVLVSFGGERLRPWGMNLRLAHGPCPMEAHESMAHGMYVLEEVE